MTEPLFIGVDGGGTSCRARIRDPSGTLLGEGRGGPANVRLGPEPVMESIIAACRGALEQAGLRDEDLRRAHVGLGLAGANQKQSALELLSWPKPFAHTVLDTDAYTAWLGAFRGKAGAILIVGTGSVGFGVFDGEPVYVGGWGADISDEGSGATIGREAIRRALWAFDGRAAPTPLTDKVLEFFDRSGSTIVKWAAEAKPADYARFAPFVFEYAERRDPLGLAIARRAATDVALIASRLLDLGAPRICLIGGLSEPLRPWLPPPIQSRLASPQSDAMDGAILMAQRQQDSLRESA
jgi:glucosamine kinase